jgi:ABC-type multidrug transport system fused ATPase/permease subunit
MFQLFWSDQDSFSPEMMPPTPSTAKTGHLFARLTKDLEEIGEVAHHGPEDNFIALMTIIGAILLLRWTHPILAMITAALCRSRRSSRPTTAAG